MTSPVPPAALAAARAAVPFVNGDACRRILAAGAPAIRADAEERFAAAAREELAKPLAELGAKITREATAAERERCAQLAEQEAASADLQVASDEASIVGAVLRAFAQRLRAQGDGIVRLERRSLPEQLRYLAGRLTETSDAVSVALALHVIANEQDGTERITDGAL